MALPRPQVLLHASFVPTPRPVPQTRQRSARPGDKQNADEDADGDHSGDRKGRANPDGDLSQGLDLHQTGGRTLAVNRATASDFSGSATVMVSIDSHFGHSKVRLSDPSGRGAMRASIIRLRQRPQRGRSIEDNGIEVKETSGSLVMILPHASRRVI